MRRDKTTFGTHTHTDRLGQLLLGDQETFLLFFFLLIFTQNINIVALSAPRGKQLETVKSVLMCRVTCQHMVLYSFHESERVASAYRHKKKITENNSQH